MIVARAIAAATKQNAAVNDRAVELAGPPTASIASYSARQHDSFDTSMTRIDVVDRHALASSRFHEPRVRRAALQAGTAAVPDGSR